MQPQPSARHMAQVPNFGRLYFPTLRMARAARALTHYFINLIGVYHV
jgi:hypothetical protein